jgi:iron complex transport system substrate-binding protein
VDHVKALAPDLILLDPTSGLDDATVRALRRVAPTARIGKAGQDWRAAFAAQADALNRQTEAAHVLHELDARVAQVRRALRADAGARVAVARWSGAGAPTATDAPAAEGMLAGLGLARAPDALRADWLFLDTPGDDGDDARAGRRALRAARAAPGLAVSKAVRRGHVVPVDGSAWSSAGGPIAEREVVDDVARALGR